MGEVTRILTAIEQGDPHAAEEEALRAAGRAIRLGGLGGVDGPALWGGIDPAPTRSAE
jgi:hypothetical protein